MSIGNVPVSRKIPIGLLLCWRGGDRRGGVGRHDGRLPLPDPRRARVVVGGVQPLRFGVISMATAFWLLDRTAEPTATTWSALPRWSAAIVAVIALVSMSIAIGYGIFAAGGAESLRLCQPGVAVGGERGSRRPRSAAALRARARRRGGAARLSNGADARRHRPDLSSGAAVVDGAGAQGRRRGAVYCRGAAARRVWPSGSPMCSARGSIAR